MSNGFRLADQSCDFIEVVVDFLRPVLSVVGTVGGVASCWRVVVESSVDLLSRDPTIKFAAVTDPLSKLSSTDLHGHVQGGGKEGEEGGRRRGGQGKRGEGEHD